MSSWTRERLERLIADGVEESVTLEYKRAAALTNSDAEVEITRDVSAFANSTGGTLIYGIAEPADKHRRHRPERLDPVRRAEVTKEWLEHIIQTIQPRIDGVIIDPVTIDDAANTVCYVVEVPQSHTAHQARDHVYYMRQNFNRPPMDDYQVRLVMGRRTHPKIQASIYVNKRTKSLEREGLILVRLENVGRVLARHVMVEMELPIDMAGIVGPEEPVLSKTTDEGTCHLLRLTPGLREMPIFPGSDLTLRRVLHIGGTIVDLNRKPVVSTRTVKVSVFADEAPPIRATLDVAPVISGWTPINQETTVGRDA